MKRIVWILCVGVGFMAMATVGCSDDEPVAPLTWAQLRNATYPSQLTPGTDIVLVDGSVQSATPDSAAPYPRLIDVGAFGEIDDRRGEDAVVFLAERDAAGAVTTSAIAVGNEDGEPIVASAASVGVDVLIRAVTIENQSIILRVNDRGSVDVDALTVDESSRVYKLEDDQLGLAGESVETVALAPPADFFPSRTALESSGDHETERTLGAREIVTFLLAGVSGQHAVIEVTSPHDSAILSIQGITDEVQVLDRSEYSTRFEGDIGTTQVYAVHLASVSGTEAPVTLRYSLSAPPAGAEVPALPEPETIPDLAVTVPIVMQGDPEFARVPLGDLSVDAAAFLPSRAPSHGSAVVDPATLTMYVDNPDEAMETASIIKFAVMTCVMLRAEEQGRLVDEWELSLMWPMITVSDNDATDTLWSDLGGGPGMTACLGGVGAEGIVPYDGPYWGTSTATAAGMAALMAGVAYGDTVNALHRAAALTMLASVVDGQRWGIAAGADASDNEIVGIKDGWYPDDDGWRVNSIGYISPLSPNDAPYAIAVMTNYQDTQEYGIATIEGVAEPVFGEMRGVTTAAAP